MQCPLKNVDILYFVVNRRDALALQLPADPGNKVSGNQASL